MCSVDEQTEILLRSEIRRVLSSFFDDRNANYGEVLTSNANVVFDGLRHWDPQKLSTALVHDDDYVVFSHLRDKNSLVLDIGAHFGYSVASIWAAGCKSRILSFEPTLAYAEPLESLNRLTYGRSSFLPVGLGRAFGIKQHVTPVLNGIAIGALSTMNPQPDLQSLEKNIVDYFFQHIKADVFQQFRLLISEVTVRSLDELAASPDNPFKDAAVSAIKIDVEGYEVEVLLGGTYFLQQHKPLLLVENGHKNLDIVAILEPLGYRPAKRIGRTLVPSALQLNSLNGFFYHQANEALYEGLGLLERDADLAWPECID